MVSSKEKKNSHPKKKINTQKNLSQPFGKSQTIWLQKQMPFCACHCIKDLQSVHSEVTGGPSSCFASPQWTSLDLLFHCDDGDTSICPFPWHHFSAFLWHDFLVSIVLYYIGTCVWASSMLKIIPAASLLGLWWVQFTAKTSCPPNLKFNISKCSPCMGSHFCLKLYLGSFHFSCILQNKKNKNSAEHNFCLLRSTVSKCSLLKKTDFPIRD